MRAWLLVALAACGTAEPEPAPPEADVPQAATPEPAEEAPPDDDRIDETDVVQGLVGAPGRDQVLAHCTACHATKLITQNRMSREQWDKTITWMQETQKLWPIPDEARQQILDYLELTQGLSGLDDRVTPWAQPLYQPNPVW